MTGAVKRGPRDKACRSGTVNPEAGVCRCRLTYPMRRQLRAQESPITVTNGPSKGSDRLYEAYEGRQGALSMLWALILWIALGMAILRGCFFAILRGHLL